MALSSAEGKRVFFLKVSLSLGMSGFFTHIPGEGTKAGVIRDSIQPASLILKIIPVGVHFMPALQVGKLRGELGRTDSK